MLGNMLAGCDETPGEIIEYQGKKYKKYFGSTSIEQKEKHTENIKNDKNYLKRNIKKKNIKKPPILGVDLA